MLNPVESLASAVYGAIHKDLPDVEYRDWTPAMKKDGIPHEEAPIKTRRPYGNEVEVFHFPQTWGSTALGFGGIGGASMTTAYTTAVIYGHTAAVYFSGRFAYLIKEVNHSFLEDLRAFNLSSIDKHLKYER